MARKLILSLAAASLALGAVSSASARGYHGHRGHYHHRHHGHGGGGKAAAIALGVVGGAIILNELAENRARDRYYEDRYYRDRYYEGRARERAYEDGYYDGRADERRYDDRYDDRAYYDDGASYDDEVYDDSGLAGGEPVYGGPPAYSTPDTDYDRAPRVISAAAAYRACLDHARSALGQRGFVVSAPYRPETVEDRGGALLMTATVTAQRGADRWARAMSCEASEGRVFRLELI
ncbi:hypothetical protein [Hyphococcus sp.]|uniref:hypothetical protein n=1 Tax=Hyphococcus sp. TaxID=2038636 RepID=UPI0035C78068